MKFTKSLVAMAAISAGMMFAGAAHVDANSTTKHTVQTGDTISGLSQQYKVSQKKIKKANKSKNVDTIYVGQVFIFDGKGNVKVDKNSAKAPVKATSKNSAAKSNQQVAVSDDDSAQTTAVTTDTSSADVQQTAPVAKATPKAAPAPVQQQATYSAPAPAAQAPVASDATMDGIAQAESGNNYNARNGQYIGKYQLTASYLNGDYSPANQERVAQQYAISRYGSVAAAAAYHAANGSW